MALVRATAFRPMPSKLEQRYLQPWRQIFCSLDWVEMLLRSISGYTVTTIGKDLKRLDDANKTWNSFDATGLRLLIVVTLDKALEDFLKYL